MEGINIDFVYEAPPASTHLVELLTHVGESDICLIGDGDRSNQVRYSLGWEGSDRNEAQPTTAFEQLGTRKAGSVNVPLQDAAEFDPVVVSIQFIDQSVEVPHLDAPDQFLVSVSVDDVYFDQRKRSETELVAHSDLLLRLTETMYEVADPVHVVGLRYMPALEDGLFPIAPIEFGAIRIARPIDWMAIFEPETLDRVGSDWLEAIEFWRRKELAGGAELVVLAPHPRSYVDEKLDEIGAYL